MNHTRQVNVGGVRIGGGAPIAIQSMSTFSPTDTARAAAQINALGAAGADIVRVAVPDKKAAEALRDLRALTEVPIVADIHFDYRLALTAMEAGVDGLRINPGNIGRRENVVKVVEMARQTGTPIRIGINAGSLPQDLLDAAGGHPTAEGMVEGALRHVRILEEENFRDIVISVKSSDVPMMVRANRILAEQTEYPLHLGVTEAGTEYRGTVKSAIGIGALLLDGIGEDGSLKEGAREAVMEELRRHFRPEFLNRVDETVLFLPLRRDQVTRIVDLQMDRLRKRLEERKITLGITDAAREFIAGEAYDPVYGARPLKRYMQQYVETPLARELVSGRILDGQTVQIDVRDGELVFQNA